jgi:hypothetical protein
MYNAFKKAFEKLLKNNLGTGHMWDFRTDKYFGFVSDEMIEVFSVDQEAGETAAVFSCSMDSEPALIDDLGNEILREAYIALLNLRPWVLLNDETNSINADNWLIIIAGDPIEIYVIVVGAWEISHPIWTLTKATSLAKDSDTDKIKQATDKILKNKKYFVVCDECSSHLPAGYMHSDTYCMGCAQSKYGIVY